MSDRDELAATIEGALDRSHGIIAWTGAAQEDIADAILAAGYRKSRTITTAEELESLAAESVLLAGSRVYQKERGALMDLGIGLLGYEEVLEECGRLLCVWEPTP